MINSSLDRYINRIKKRKLQLLCNNSYHCRHVTKKKRKKYYLSSAHVINMLSICCARSEQLRTTNNEMLFLTRQKLKKEIQLSNQDREARVRERDFEQETLKL